MPVQRLVFAQSRKRLDISWSAELQQELPDFSPFARGKASYNHKRSRDRLKESRECIGRIIGWRLRSIGSLSGLASWILKTDIQVARRTGRKVEPIKPLVAS